MKWRKPPRRKTSLEKILALLPKLTPTERRQLQARLSDLSGISGKQGAA